MEKKDSKIKQLHRLAGRLLLRSPKIKNSGKLYNRKKAKRSNNTEEDSSPAPKGSLIREWVELADGTEYDVCMQCHAYILKTVMEDDNTGKGIHEVKRCPECENE